MIGVRYVAEIYLTSDAAGADACVTVRSPKPLPEIKGPVVAQDVLRHFGQPIATFAGDWRLMTDDEINEYREGA